MLAPSLRKLFERYLPIFKFNRLRVNDIGKSQGKERKMCKINKCKLIVNNCELYNNNTYLEGQAWANSVDLDEMLQNVASPQGLHCLPFIQQFLDTKSGSKLYLFKF